MKLASKPYFLGRVTFWDDLLLAGLAEAMSVFKHASGRGLGAREAVTVCPTNSIATPRHLNSLQSLSPSSAFPSPVAKLSAQNRKNMDSQFTAGALRGSILKNCLHIVYAFCARFLGLNLSLELPARPQSVGSAILIADRPGMLSHVALHRSQILNQWATFLVYQPQRVDARIQYTSIYVPQTPRPGP